MREITDHKINGLNEALTITALDEPGAGGASHQYSIRWQNKVDETEPHCYIGFQKGPPQEVGVNGISMEALMAILIDRLKAFANGPYPSEETSSALKSQEMALAALKMRTLDRTKRGVEGTYTK